MVLCRLPPILTKNPVGSARRGFAATVGVDSAVDPMVWVVVDSTPSVGASFDAARRVAGTVVGRGMATTVGRPWAG